jgi:hypothetical protein
MKTLFSTIIIFTLCLAQEPTAAPEPIEKVQSLDSDTTQQVPSGLDIGYKGLAWGSKPGSPIPTSLTKIDSNDSLATSQSFNGNLGPDSVSVTYFFADSGFWKVEIDILISLHEIDDHISNFRRLEKNISEIYGPPKRMNQQESGPSGSYSNHLDQKFTRAFYRSTWSVTPTIIDLYLNSSVLLPATDLPIFSGNSSTLKLVYYNPDYMHSSQPVPQAKKVQSIFEIY